jgi:hypothetical protein
MHSMYGLPESSMYKDYLAENGDWSAAFNLLVHSPLFGPPFSSGRALGSQFNF